MSETAKDQEMLTQMSATTERMDRLLSYVEANVPYMDGSTARDLTVALHDVMAKSHTLLAICEKVKAHRDARAAAAAKRRVKLPERKD